MTRLGAERNRFRASATLAATALWLAGAVVVWNVVFDAHIGRGARGYVDGQQLFAEGRGPRLDMVRAMDAAKRAGLRAAWSWSGAELAAGAALAAALGIRSRGRGRASRPGASR